jgi:hypothetical protein
MLYMSRVLLIPVKKNIKFAMLILIYKQPAFMYNSIQKNIQT